MNEFDHRWQTCAARARQDVAGPVPVPVGFATRTWARWTGRSHASLTAVWTALSFRALILATLVLVVLATAEFSTASADNALTPHLEDVVANVWGTL
jgi:hypothetical protein